MNTFRALVQIVSLTIILPLGGWFLLHRGFSIWHKELYLVRASCAFLTLGVLVIGIAAPPSLLFVGKISLSCQYSSTTSSQPSDVSKGVFLVGLGYGINALLRSLMTMIVKAENISLLYVTMTATQYLAEAIAGPFYSLIFTEGIRLGRPWLGLPFLVAAGLYILSATMIAQFRLVENTDTGNTI